MAKSNNHIVVIREELKKNSQHLLEVNKLGQEVSNVKNHSIDRKVILGVRSLDLGDGKIRELLGENRDKNASHLAERLLNNEEIGSSLIIESEIGSELGELGREVLSSGIVLNVRENESSLIEDVVELSSVLSSEEILSLIDKHASVSNLLIAVEKLGVSGSLKHELSEVLKESSSLGISSHLVGKKPDSSLKLVKSSNSRELLHNGLGLLPQLVVSLGWKLGGRGNVGVALDSVGLSGDLIEEVEKMIQSGVVLGSASKLGEKRSELLEESLLLLLGDLGVLVHRMGELSSGSLSRLLSQVLLSRSDNSLEEIQNLDQDLSELSRSNGEDGDRLSIVPETSGRSSKILKIRSSNWKSSSGNSTGLSGGMSAGSNESLKLLVLVLLVEHSRRRIENLLDILNENLSLGAQVRFVLGLIES